MSDLTDKEIKFIDAYLSNKNMTETCKALKISRNKAYTYYRDARVKAEIDKRKTALINETTLYLQGNLKECSIMLMDIIKNPNTSPQVRINAINSIFNNCNKLTETSDIMTRLADIEEKLAQQEGNNYDNDI